ncbi:M28 family peptidase [Plebeiibacterium sediminum]|uniref:M28 family peptidase n=1 Tax=Plebeiibacterium sediminum TaxID=2992112 RepID=A0AAE3SDN6_9BACT|nr:M28 family peptidase [Plebeiobacterium sediminum]MCW3785042.1 M28 family peptidase [Plebeiobacterium sediminum]
MLKYITLITLTIIFGCNSNNAKTNIAGEKVKKQKAIKVPSFNADSAYQYVDAQVAFGPRVPNTEAHTKCAEYLSSKLEEFGADVIVQEAQLIAFDNKVLNAKNIIGQYNPKIKNRVMLFAHWDSRPFADHCEDPAKRNDPILGANDGASGVGVLLEVARCLKNDTLPIGIDIIFFDAEDYGIPDHLDVQWKPDTWCLGSQYWSKNPHTPDYYAQYGILLDMVGAPQATFYQEQQSLQFAPRIVKKVWNTANDIGFGNYFIYDKGGAITDDHVYVNNIRGIPCIDIIQYDPSTNSSFGSYWHTHKDNMDVIDRNTMKAVGQTLLHVIYNE